MPFTLKCIYVLKENSMILTFIVRKYPIGSSPNKFQLKFYWKETSYPNCGATVDAPIT